MYAIIATGGKQYKVAVGDEIFIEKLDQEAGTEYTFSDVIAVFNEDGITYGDAIKDVTVSGEVLKQGKGKKIIIFKYKPKKNYRRKTGHRQPYTKVKITNIG